MYLSEINKKVPSGNYLKLYSLQSEKTSSSTSLDLMGWRDRVVGRVRVWLDILLGTNYIQLNAIHPFVSTHLLCCGGLAFHWPHLDPNFLRSDCSNHICRYLKKHVTTFVV